MAVQRKKSLTRSQRQQKSKKEYASMERILVMSDIHGNLSALEAVLAAEPMERLAGVVLLGDLIDYGPRSNEVISRIKQIPEDKILVNLWGNHEAAIYTGADNRFSSERGKQSAAVTRGKLTAGSWEYLQQMQQAGKQELWIGGYKCLAVHGSLKDYFWKEIGHSEDGEEYAAYDIVFSGHSHIPHFFCHYYPADCPEFRNKKRTIFVNPGSVGQPRDHNPNAHYAAVDVETLSVWLNTADYDIDYEMSLFTNETNIFYRERIKRGV